MKKLQFSLSLLFVTIASPLLAQSLDYSGEITLDYLANNASSDREGNIYISSNKGDIFKYGQNGDLLYTYSANKNAEITILNAWNGLRIFAFFKDLQQYILLDRFLRSSGSYSFNQQVIAFAELATTGSDQNIWIFDIGDFRLKKYNVLADEIEINSPLNPVFNGNNYDITSLNEYKNFLFITDRNEGIYIFDNMGTFRRKIPLTGISRIDFINNQLYYLDNGQLRLIDIYQGTSSHIEINKQISGHPKMVILTNENGYIIEDSKLVICDISW